MRPRVSRARRLLQIVLWLRGLRYALFVLIGVEFADELASGVPYATAFAVQETLGVGSATLNAWTFLVPQVVALVIEPYLMLRSERWGTARSLRLGLFGMALSLLLGGLAPSAEVLGIAVALYFPSSGLACGVAEVALMNASDERSTSLTDWTLAGTLGDLGTPLVLWALDSAGLSWRWTFTVIGLAVLAFAALGLRRLAASPGNDGGAELERFQNSAAEDGSRDSVEAEPSLREALRLIRGNPTLVWWLLAAASCSLLDELFASQLGIYLSHSLGHADSARPVAFQLLAMGGGGVLGLVLQRALLRRYPDAIILAVACAGTILVSAAWFLALPGSASLVLAGVLGATIAPHYPLAQARAYDALPGRASVVAAASRAFSAFDLLGPVLVGVLSDAYSPAVGLCALLLQPLAILVAFVRCYAATRPKRGHQST